MSLISTNATIVGSFINIQKGSKINSITIKLGNVKTGLGMTTTGRHLGLAYWVVDKEFNKCNMKINPNNPPGSMHWFDGVSSKNISGYNIIEYNDGTSYKYVNTNLIPGDTSEDVTFTFNNPEEITESKIFIALIATRGLLSSKDIDDVDYAWTCYDEKKTGIIYDKITPVDSNDKLLSNTGRSLNIVNMNVTNSSIDTSTGSNKPSPIKFKNISYRTWSSLYTGKTDDLSGTMANKTHQIAVLDGGEECGYLYNSTSNRQSIIDNNEIITETINNTAYTFLPYIMNDNDFNNDYGIPEGRLSDVYFDRPSEVGLVKTGINIVQPRWCFKRSRIKFTIPGITNSKYGTIISYLVRTPVNKPGIYSTTPKKKFYSQSETQNDIDVVICPRDEGILDNMPFEIVFYRQYATSKTRTIGYKSDDSVYKFHTYQKPIVNITYPKIIRNDSTWEGNDKRNFKYAKIPTSNIYSTFDGEQAIRNKYVCDALTVLFSTPKNDDSGIPMFVRFYVAEFKYGRDGHLDHSEPGKEITSTQDLFKSHDTSKYTSLNDILNGTYESDDMTASVTNIFNNDGSPLLLSGKFNDKTLKEIGEKYHLWTFNTWDGVVEDDEKDVKVFNAWQSESYVHDSQGINRVKDKDGNFTKIIISKDIVGDHKDKPTVVEKYGDGDWKSVSYPVCKMLLFRAGYCYLIRIRMFHGAVAGAIGKKYGANNEICIGKSGTGTYNYTNAFYGGIYPINDGSKYGSNNPYNKWHGPDDGTSGLSLKDSKLNETFPGFSQVDYSIFEAVAPYSSLSNLITVHPTSPNISVNQCLSFNYRHLAKNIGDIDDNIWNNKGELQKINGEEKLVKNLNNRFGRTFGGIHNTISRIMAMYTSCAETILKKYFAVRGINNGTGGNSINGFYNANKMGITDACSGPNGADKENGSIVYNVKHEKLTLKIVPINTEGHMIDKDNDSLSYVETLSRTYNVPLINEYNVTSFDTAENLFKGGHFYTHNYTGTQNKDDKGTNFIPDNGVIYRCGCYEFNNYRLKLKSDASLIENNSPGDVDISPNTSGNEDIWQWPEKSIIYKTLKKSYQGSINEDPLGNTYRWQPVINAIQVNNDTIQELQIQNITKNIETVNNNKLSKKDSITLNGTMQANEPMYLGYNNIDGDIQKSYFYEDVSNNTTGSVKNMSNNSTNRFTINEFAGVITGNIDSSGYPSMQTLSSTENKHFKYFDYNSTLNSYGELFKRVPTICDCENGIVTKNTINFGSLGRFKDSELAGQSEIYSLDENGDNAFPLVRTTHYLYFKTYINVAFTLEAKVKVEYTPIGDCEETTTTSGEKTITIHTHTSNTKESEEKVFYLNSDGTAINISSESNKESNNVITFANNDGIAAVYAEDNNGWGRCLSADDKSALSFKPDGGLHALPISSTLGCVDAAQISGGIEVPLLVRYTPLLQPNLISETINSKQYNPISKSVTIKEDRYYNKSTVVFNDGNSNIETNIITLNINYPYIPENNAYTTRNVNGGVDNISFENYHVDVDTDTPNNRNDPTKATNLDFLGGYGICTGYTILLVPSDPNVDALKSKIYNGYNKTVCLIDSEIDNYFKNTDGHWNYFKQPNNYYRNGHIYNLRSKTQKDAGPVLVAYNVPLNDNDKGQFLKDNYTNGGRTNLSINLNINDLRKCKVNYKGNIITNKDFNNEIEINNANINLDSKSNKLNAGLIYDLVIVPVYANYEDTTYNWTKDLSGTINGQVYGSNIDKEPEVHFAGSNPLVLFNYLQVSSNIIDSTPGGGGGGSDPIPPDPENDDPVDIYKIHNTDGGIVFPNVDHELFNMKTGKIKESPGFWLNNSFRLILRLPSYRTDDTTIDDIDNVTVEKASNGAVKDPDNFKFKDIQIHIGKYKELTDFVTNQGTGSTMETTLDKITDKDELAKLHIISYKDYYATSGVFSKRLDDLNDINNDSREIATAGALDPNMKNYEHRFIEVNLSNTTIKDDNYNDVPIYTKYPEGYYIQFRVQSSYATNDENYNWSPWYGGSCDGGSHWWGSLGTDYYVPIRNYSEIFTEFRNYITEAYPGSNKLFGKGSLLSHSDINSSSKTKPKSTKQKTYYKLGLGNVKENKDNKTLAGSNVLTRSTSSVTKYVLNKDTHKYESDNIDISLNNDWPYDGLEAYKKHYDTTTTLNNSTKRLWEMLYVDFIIRNLSKLYYKPNYNNIEDAWNNEDSRKQYLKYHLSTPYINNNPVILNDKTWSWDDTEYNLFKTDASNIDLTNENTINEDKTSKENQINGSRLKYDTNKGYWDLNKYYRKPITKNDFDELNQHLIDLTNFIGLNCLTGKNDTNEQDNKILDTLTIYEDKLQFNKTRKAIIGSSLDITTANGIGYINNLNNQLTDINYIQKIWDNIKLLCQCYNDSEEQL